MGSKNKDNKAGLDTLIALGKPKRVIIHATNIHTLDHVSDKEFKSLGKGLLKDIGGDGRYIELEDYEVTLDAFYLLLQTRRINQHSNKYHTELLRIEHYPGERQFKICPDICIHGFPQKETAYFEYARKHHRKMIAEQMELLKENKPTIKYGSTYGGILSIMSRFNGFKDFFINKN